MIVNYKKKNKYELNLIIDKFFRKVIIKYIYM